MAVNNEDLPDRTRTADPPAARTTRAAATAWFLAVLPVAWVALDVVALELFGASDAAMGSLWFATLTNWAVVIADSTALRRAGVRVSAWWGILLLPVYVVLRTRRGKNSLVVPALFFALAAAHIVSGDLWLDALNLS